MKIFAETVVAIDVLMMTFAAAAAAVVATVI